MQNSDLDQMIKKWQCSDFTAKSLVVSAILFLFGSIIFGIGAVTFIIGAFVYLAAGGAP